ncbi:MAG: sulfite exporter TauE/SafE family protein [Pseudomonadota bacterium]
MGEQSVPWLSFSFASVALACFASGFLRGFVGFGGGLVSVPILSVVYGPLAAVPIASIMALPALFQLLPPAVRDGESSVLIPLGIGILIAAPAGSATLAAIDPLVTKIAISLLVLVMVLLLVRNWRLPGADRTPVLVAAGGVSGFIHGAAGIGGPPLVAVALSRPGEARQQRGNVLGAVALVSITTVASLWYFGLFTRAVIVVSLVLVPVYSIGAWLGARYFSGAGQQYYRPIALVLLGVIGVATLGLALLEYAER